MEEWKDNTVLHLPHWTSERW